MPNEKRPIHASEAESHPFAPEPSVELTSRELTSRVSPASRVFAGPLEARVYGRDVASVPPWIDRFVRRPASCVVVQPVHEADVAAVLRFAREKRLAVFPRGVSSGPFGGSIPTRFGIVLDLSAMNRILEIDEKERTVRVEPGARWADTAEALRRLGLAPLTCPSSRFSTIGGWASTGGVGVDSFGHGAFADAVLSARVALADGEVKAFARGDDRLIDFLGTEGQLGVFTELTLRVRTLPAASLPVLAVFDADNRALDAFTRIAGADTGASHAVFYDAERLAEENTLFRDRTGGADDIVPSKSGVLLHFEDRERADAFRRDPVLTAGGAIASDAAAHYLWAERFFPLKAQRIGPSLLGAEVVLFPAALGLFIASARRLARRFHAEPAIEATLARNGDTVECVAIVSFTCDRRNSVDYGSKLLLVVLLTHAGVRAGGRPYGLGVWNAPFFRRRYAKATRRALTARKAEMDPANLLNPGKFFAMGTRFGRVPGGLHRSGLIEAGLHFMRAGSLFAALFARRCAKSPNARWTVPAPGRDGGRPLLLETGLRCTFCGGCVSTCPAYMITRDERVTGRAKLQLADLMESGARVSEPDAAAQFQCLRCRLCEEACQTRLPLVDCYGALERQVEERFGKQGDLVARFVERLDAERDRLKTVFGLDMAEVDLERVNGPAPGARPDPAAGGAP